MSSSIQSMSRANFKICFSFDKACSKIMTNTSKHWCFINPETLATIPWHNFVCYVSFNVIRAVAKICHEILMRRQDNLYKNTVVYCTYVNLTFYT